MKKLLLLSFILSCHIAFCNTNAKLHGTIKHPLADSIVLSYSYPSMTYQPTTFSAKLEKNGTFIMPFTVPEESVRAFLSNGDQQTELFISPGADLDVFIDGNNFDSSVHYKGKGSEVANFMAAHLLALNTTLSFGMTVQTICGREIKEYKAALKEMENKELAFLQKNGNDLPAAFKEYFITYYHYMVYLAMQGYPRIHEMMKQQTNDYPVIPKKTYAIINDIPEEFNDHYFANDGYQAYLMNFFYLKLAAANAMTGLPDSVQPSPDSIAELIYTRMPPRTAEFQTIRMIYTLLNYTSMENTEQSYKKFADHFPHSKYLAELDQAIWKKKAIGIGKPAIDFDINTPDGKKMMLSDLKGNVVYMDFWSRTCTPCMAEIQHAKKIKEYFKDRDVVFLYISVDDDKTWKTAIKELDIQGLHTRVTDRYESEVIKKYAIHGTPAYYIIDKQGKFASVENVARPSSNEKLIRKIETLLK